MLGKTGGSGSGPHTLDRPTGVAVAPDGDIFGWPSSQKHQNASVMKFAADGRFIKRWGSSAQGRATSTSRMTSFAGARKAASLSATAATARIQVFDQEVNFVAAWPQFGTPSSLFVGQDDTIRIGLQGSVRQERRVAIGNAREDALAAFSLDNCALCSLFVPPMSPDT